MQDKLGATNHVLPPFAFAQELLSEAKTRLDRLASRNTGTSMVETPYSVVIELSIKDVSLGKISVTPV